MKTYWKERLFKNLGVVLDYLLDQLALDNSSPEVRKAISELCRARHLHLVKAMNDRLEEELFRVKTGFTQPAPGQPGGGLTLSDFDDDGKLRRASGD
jgi:hypothetical protein